MQRVGVLGAVDAADAVHAEPIAEAPTGQRPFAVRNERPGHEVLGHAACQAAGNGPAEGPVSEILVGCRFGDGEPLLDGFCPPTALAHERQPATMQKLWSAGALVGLFKVDMPDVPMLLRPVRYVR